jgi:hypothetical protein
VLKVVEASRAVLAPGRRTGSVRLVREALWFFWEQPRLPLPLLDSKYPLHYPWSRGAQAVWSDSDGQRPRGGWGLVIEHLYPREFVVRDLLRGRGRGPTEAAALLRRRLMAAVVTVAEDRLLPSRGKSPQAWAPYGRDPWLRYRSGLIDLSAFAALTSEGAQALGGSSAFPASSETGGGTTAIAP